MFPKSHSPTSIKMLKVTEILSSILIDSMHSNMNLTARTSSCNSRKTNVYTKSKLESNSRTIIASTNREIYNVQRDIRRARNAPDILETTSGAKIFKNRTLVSTTIAFASMDFPHPGGLCNKIPLGGGTPKRSYT